MTLVGRGSSSLPGDLPHVRRQVQLLHREKVTTPDSNLELIDELWADLAVNVLRADWSELAIFETEKEHIAGLREILETAANIGGKREHIERALAELVA